ncbi:FkbM family methyltransferase [Litoribacter alkaliphilus]|uniref:FkbM family methyltransferase n=1 Tax=Litoribacter ruber TaxID=702568 RepID=A0AAP2CIN0_9BACT|nr:FkbM family methyltransferase [Litoribacter alkaliphilus]MBS9523275.1 FkbM family methyltransferase [Litoribacter alkaliphilus]
MRFITRLFKKKVRSIPDKINIELNRLRGLSSSHKGYSTIFTTPFRYHHAASFVNTYMEIYQDEIYKFNPKIKSGGVILDCGANMGLSVMYFSKNYPKHQIIAFEPEKAIFEVLEENVEKFKLNNVTLHQKAVWTEETELTFSTDGGMGGRVNNLYKSKKKPVEKVKTVDLKTLLNEQVDFLKLDIEGAEVEVLKACKGSLSKVQHIFFEYHNDIHKPQSLHELLKLITEEGFKYHLKESSVRRRPFVDKNLICETFDMAITVFCYK